MKFGHMKRELNEGNILILLFTSPGLALGGEAASHSRQVQVSAHRHLPHMQPPAVQLLGCHGVMTICILVFYDDDDDI